MLITTLHHFLLGSKVRSYTSLHNRIIEGGWYLFISILSLPKFNSKKIPKFTQRSILTSSIPCMWNDK